MAQSLLAALLFVALAICSAAQPKNCRAGEIEWTRKGTYMGAATNNIGLIFSEKYLLAFALNNGSAIWRRSSTHSRSRGICIFEKDRTILVNSLLPREGESLYGLIDSTTGKYIWKRLLPNSGFNSEGPFDCDALQSLDYFELRRAEQSTYVSKADGAVLWNDKKVRSRHQSPSLMQNDLLVYILRTQTNFSLEAREPTTGDLLWHRQLKWGRSFSKRYRDVFFDQRGRNLAIVNMTTGLTQWTVEGRIYDEDLAVRGPLLIHFTAEDLGCSVDRSTGEKIWCIKLKGFPFIHELIPGSQDVMLKMGQPRNQKLLRIDHRTGKVLYAPQIEYQRINGNEPFFFDVVLPKRTETYYTDAGRIARLGENGTELWVTSVPSKSFKYFDPCWIGQFLYLSSQGNQRVFQFEHCEGSGLIALHRNTGRVEWLVYEEKKMIGFETIIWYLLNGAPIYHGEKTAIFSIGKQKHWSSPSTPGVGETTVRAIRTRC